MSAEMLQLAQLLTNHRLEVNKLESEIESLREQLKTARADVLTSFVSDTTETGQFGWSDCQWLDDWKHEWLEQQAKG